ncbi:MAG TPA: methylated-DNA--[protein]-cysteine S-methyltransferase [Chlamydiales bacterium]|nr:methylated-DNA--[protein]-cysteine S-methyltransferase [Chlamydiales bacterium]
MCNSAVIETPIGKIYAVSDEKALHYLGFEKQDDPFGKTIPLEQIRNELDAYFRGELQEFKTPIFLNGSAFQNKVWKALLQIPFGKTTSYKDVAKTIGNGKASRAVGNANGANPFIFIVPCHRVIAFDGTLGGYSAGLEKKLWLLRHECCAISPNVAQ